MDYFCPLFSSVNNKPRRNRVNRNQSCGKNTWKTRPLVTQGICVRHAHWATSIEQSEPFLKMRQPEVVGSNPTKRVASQFCAKNDGSSTKNIFFLFKSVRKQVLWCTQTLTRECTLARGNWSSLLFNTLYIYRQRDFLLYLSAFELFGDPLFIEVKSSWIYTAHSPLYC
jgi:hypothetical protein